MIVIYKSRSVAAWETIGLLLCLATASANAGGYTLDGVTRSAVQTIDPEVTAPQTKKFVQINVAEVINPQRIPLSFEVHYRNVQGEKIFLGTFSLFPPDNPGTFIVATGGRLQTGGTVIVSLIPLQEINVQSEVQVCLKRIAFVATVSTEPKE